jgi:WD40 repeat protein
MTSCVLAARCAPQVVLTYATHDGHQAAVMSILVSGPYMFSADQGGHIKVWDLASGSCCQTVNKAHEGAITKLALYGDSALLSGGLDGTVRCWCPGAAPSVLSEQPDYVFRGEQEDEQQQQQRQQQRNPPPIRSVSQTGAPKA